MNDSTHHDSSYPFSLCVDLDPIALINHKHSNHRVICYGNAFQVLIQWTTVSLHYQDDTLKAFMSSSQLPAVYNRIISLEPETMFVILVTMKDDFPSDILIIILSDSLELFGMGTFMFLNFWLGADYASISEQVAHNLPKAELYTILV